MTGPQIDQLRKRLKFVSGCEVQIKEGLHGLEVYFQNVNDTNRFFRRIIPILEDAADHHGVSFSIQIVRG